LLNAPIHTESSKASKNRSKSFFQARAQAKLEMGKPNDKYEVEADKVADKLVSKVSTNGDPFFAPSAVVQHKLQKQEEQEVQQKGLAESITPVIQLMPEKEEEAPASEDQTVVQGQMIQTNEDEAPVSTDAEEIQAKGENGPASELPGGTQIQTKPEAPVLAPIIPLNPTLQKKTEQEEVQTKEEEEVQAKEEEEGQKIQTSGGAESPPNSGSNLESKLQSSRGGGSPLLGNTRSEMESGFGADFSNVRIHTDNSAVQMNQELGSQAFATGNDIFFNAGKFNPGSQSGKHLLAHELTHTVQQGASEPVRASMIQAKELLQAFGFIDLVPDWIIDGARHVPGYTLFTVVAGYDPLIDQDVERTPINLLQGLLGLVPFGSVIFDKLQEYGIIDQVYEWVSGKLGELGLTVQGILDVMEEAWDELEFPYTDALDVVARKFQEVVSRVTSFAGGLLDQVMTWVKEALINFAEPYLAENQAWSLIKKVIKYDPLRGEAVSATTVEILEDFLMLIGKETELEQMREKGTLQETADWLDTQMGTFTSILGDLRALINGVWDAIQPSNLANIGTSLLALAGQVGDVLQRIWDFAIEVANKVLELVKDSLLGYLSEQALTVRGYSLIRVIIGKDIFTGEVIERNVPNLIRGFMSLMEGGEEQYAQMVESGAIARIVGQIDAAVATLNMTPEAIVQLFTDLWNSFTINDLLNPIETFTRIIAAFGEPIGRLIAFVAEIVRIVIVAILEIMNFPFDLIQNIITRSMEAIEDIKRDPIGFLKNIMRAIKQGFTQFFDNILQHLLNGVTGWLMAELGDANVPMPQDFSLRGVISWVLEILGISMDAIWEKLAEHPRIGPERVAQIRATIDTLEGIWTFIQDVQERGIVAIWERIQEQLSNLWTTVLDAVKNFIMERIVTQVTARLLSMLDPTGIMAVINGAVAFYNAVQSFIRYLREMLEMVNSFVNGVADLARGNVAPAADHLENTMDRGMPIMIGFLANQVGLSGLGHRIAEMIEAVRAMVDEALTWLINQAVDTGFALLDRAMAFGGEVVDAVMGYLGLRKTFNEGGEGHSLYFRRGSAGVLMVASTPKTIEELVEDRRTEINAAQAASPSADNTAKLTALSLVLTKNTDLRTKVREYDVAVESGGHTRPETIQQEIDNLMIEIVEQLIVAGVSSQGSNTMQTQVRFGESGGKPTSVIAEPLTQLPGNTAGSEPFEEPAGYQELITNFGWTSGERGDLWKRGHLLNHNLHGPGEARNMAMITTFTNNSMKGGIENPAKATVDGNPNKMFYYDVQVSYFTAVASKPGVELFPNRLTIEFGELSGTAGNYARSRTNGRSYSLDTPEKSNYPNVGGTGTQSGQSDAAFNESGDRDLKAASDRAGKSIPLAVFKKIKNIRNALPNRRFTDIADLTDRLLAAKPSYDKHKKALEELAATHIFMDY
jgi:Domain of unknown function (DUF4157)